MLEMARGRDQEALAAFRLADRLAGLLVTKHPRLMPPRAYIVRLLVRMGETGRAEAVLAKLDSGERESGEMRTALAALRLAQHRPQVATAALAPVLDGSAAAASPRIWLILAFMLEAIARDELGDAAAAGRAIEHALDLAEPEAVLFPFLLYPTPGLLERHARHATKHAALISGILDLLAGASRPPPAGEPSRFREQISGGETRVLRYLPTNLSAPEIAAELTLSVNTVRTHLRRLYEKLDAHSRTQAVERARALGLLAPSSRRP